MSVYTVNEALLQVAINAQDVLVFSYPSSVDGQPRMRRLSPWKLERDDEVLMGYDHDHERPRRYTVAKIGDIDIDLAEEYVMPQ